MFYSYRLPRRLLTPNPISKLLSLGDGKRLRRYRRLMGEINALEEDLAALT